MHGLDLRCFVGMLLRVCCSIWKDVSFYDDESAIFDRKDKKGTLFARVLFTLH